MQKLYILCLLNSILLSGCGSTVGSTVYPSYLVISEDKCTKNEGVDRVIVVNFQGGAQLDIFCNNGATFRVQAKAP